MDKAAFNDEFEVWESQDPEVDINELNRCDLTNRTPATVRKLLY